MNDLDALAAAFWLLAYYRDMQDEAEQHTPAVMRGKYIVDGTGDYYHRGDIEQQAEAKPIKESDSQGRSRLGRTLLRGMGWAAFPSHTRASRTVSVGSQ
jgi:hypothetical protein